MIDPVIAVSVRIIFALLFAFSAAEKIMGREMFLYQLQEYRLIPVPLVPSAGLVVIATELAIATLLLIGPPIYGVILGCLLLGVYGIAIMINLARGRTWMDCGCLGSDGEGLSAWLVVRNLSLIALLLLAALPIIDRSLVWLDYFSMIFSIAAAATFYVIFNTLLAADTRSKMWWGNQE